MSTPEGLARTAAARAATRRVFAERRAHNPEQLAKAIATVRAATRAGLLEEQEVFGDQQVKQ